MTNYYKLTIERMPGAVYVSYRRGVMVACVNDIARQCQHVGPPMVPLYEQHLANSVFEASEIKPSSVSAKCALFVLLFKEYRNVVYTPSKIERANLRHVMCTRPLLETYFMARDYPLAGPKTITDYIRNYNAVRDLLANGKPVKASFPDVYDREYERHLGDNPGKLQAYWAHLRNLGWRKVDGVWAKNGLKGDKL